VQSASTSLWLYADDVDIAVTELRDAGVRVVAEPTDQPWGERVASVADPDGYTVHLGATRSRCCPHAQVCRMVIRFLRASIFLPSRTHRCP